MTISHPQHSKPLLRVGELAKKAGKTVRALHLYEEIGLLTPVARTSGGFRLFDPSAVGRIEWIIKFQAMGFSLTEIRGFVTEFEEAQSGKAGTERVRDVFAEKLSVIREQIASLQVVENDLIEALDYLATCQGCAPSVAVNECNVCGQLGHQVGDVPALFAGLSRSATRQNADSKLLKIVAPPHSSPGYDVDVATLTTQQTSNEEPN